MQESAAACIQRSCVGAAARRDRQFAEIAPALAQKAVSARRSNLSNPSVLRRRRSGIAVGAAQHGRPPCATVELIGPPVMALQMHLGDTCEPHPVYCLVHARQTRASILTVPNEPSTCGEPLRTE